MPQAIDQEALDSPNLKVLDISNPPTRAIPHKEFPKMVYLHPKDKTKEHRHKVVGDAEELDAALKEGYREKPHIPQAPKAADFDDFERDFEGQDDETGEQAASTQKPLESLTKAQLVALAAERNVAIDTTAKKEVIIAALNAAEEE